MQGGDTRIRVRWELGRPEQVISLCRESEGFIVVLKRGNARGGSGPWRNVHLFMRGEPLGREFDYGLHIFSWGQRLGQQAKQQPSWASLPMTPPRNCL